MRGIRVRRARSAESLLVAAAIYALGGQPWAIAAGGVLVGVAVQALMLYRAGQDGDFSR